MPDAVRWYRTAVNADVHDGFPEPGARLTTDSLRSAAAGAADEKQGSSVTHRGIRLGISTRHRGHRRYHRSISSQRSVHSRSVTHRGVTRRGIGNRNVTSRGISSRSIGRHTSRGIHSRGVTCRGIRRHTRRGINRSVTSRSIRRASRRRITQRSSRRTIHRSTERLR